MDKKINNHHFGLHCFWILKIDQKLLDQMFINVLRKSPQKQFTGETYRFTIILDTSASSTSKSSTLTTLAESHPVPMNRSTAPSSGPLTGCVFSQVGAVMSWTVHPEWVHVQACGVFISGANPSSFVFQNETVGAGGKKPRQSHDDIAVKDKIQAFVKLRRCIWFSSQTQTLNYREKIKIQGEICEHIRTLVQSTCQSWRNAPHLHWEW